MTHKVDEYNQLIGSKKEEIDHLLVEKKEINNLLNDYHDIIQTSIRFNQHLAERYYESHMLMNIEQNNDMFYSGQHQTMDAIYEKQQAIDKDIRHLNENIEDIERRRNIALQIEEKGGQHNEY